MLPLGHSWDRQKEGYLAAQFDSRAENVAGFLSVDIKEAVLKPAIDRGEIFDGSPQ